MHPYSYLALGLFACFLALFLHFRAERNLSNSIANALYLKEKAIAQERRQALDDALLSQLKTASADYLESTIENIQFLRPEIQKLHATLHASPELKAEKTRLDFLENGKNTLRFRQQNFQRVGNLQEMEAKQIHPVEMNREDLKTFLACIENTPLGNIQPLGHPPNFLIKNFELIKKPLASSEEVFLVNCELIKREMIHE
jgi:hypothetical protein